MEVILGRSQFLSETAHLFTDEKTANARAKVVEWANELVTADSQAKCELLAKMQETLLGSCVELLDEFLEHILSLSHDPNMDVRKQVVCFIEQICKVKIDELPQVINIISMLLRDRSPQVIKRVIQACGSIYKNGLQWICGQSQLSDSAQQAWSVLSLVKAQILDLIDNDNDGIRTNAIKFLEGVVILQSYADEDSQKKENDFSLTNVPENLKLVKRQKLEEEALNIFDILLKFHAATHISAVNLITCTGSLCAIGKLRPGLMGPIVDAYKNLQSNLPPTLTDSQVSSVRKSLKMHLMTLLKNRGSFEYQSTLRHVLIDLGVSQSEVLRAMPKMDKQEQMRRQKRILENASSNLSKRMRLNDINTSDANLEMEIDEEELEKQRQKCTRVNEKFLAEHLRSTETVVGLIVQFLPKLPEEIPQDFKHQYTPIRDMSTQQLIAKISKIWAEEMTEKKLGPGAAAFTKDLPMRPMQSSPKTQPMEVDQSATDIGDQNVVDEEALRKEEATKKLRENIERVKGEQDVLERMKLRAKALKLQEVTKPISRQAKEKFMLESIRRVCNAERACDASGLLGLRRKILTVAAATLHDQVRNCIFAFLMEDIKQRIDLAFAWITEEYCLLQGYTRHTYFKSESRPDQAYNDLLDRLINGISKDCEFKDKIVLLRRIFLEAPLLTDGAITELLRLCLVEEYSHYCLEMIRDMVVYRPPRRNKFVRIMLNFCVHERSDVRERALEYIVQLYKHDVKLLSKRIDDFAMDWCAYLEKEKPPSNIFSADYGRPEVETAWREETAKTCLTLMLTLLPHNTDVYLDKLGKVYINTSPDLKRTILRSIDGAIKTLGSEHESLHKLFLNCPKGLETLIMRIIYILNDRIPVPNAELVQRVKDLYTNKIKDVRVLIPILSGLTRQEILNALPKMLKLNQTLVKEVFNRLLRIGSEFVNQPIAATPTDILVALHTIDLNNCELKLIIKATSICFEEKKIFTQEVLIGVLQQLVEVVPIPTLLMRSIIQSLTLYPQLSNFVLNLLQRLILKKFWRQKIIWDGFLKCCQRLKPQSLSILLQLPAQQLVDALQQCPDLRAPLLEYAESIQDEPMSGVTPQILDIITGKTVDVFVTDESGGYITLENIKKEIEEPQEISTITTVPVLTTLSIAPIKIAPTVISTDPGQPLPPGED